MILMDLTKFETLKTLSWRGLSDFLYYKALQSLLQSQTKMPQSITSLTLDFNRWEIASASVWELQRRRRFKYGEEMPKNFFAIDVLGLVKGDHSVVLRSLERLTLLGAMFDGFEDEIIHALNVGNLKSLQLRECNSTLSLLSKIVTSGLPISWKQFELRLDRSVWLTLSPSQQQGQSLIISQLLTHAEGLESLALTLILSEGTGFLDWNMIGRAIFSHLPTLRRLVLNGRKTNRCLSADADIIASPRRRISCGVEEVLGALTLDFLGIYCCQPYFVSHSSRPNQARKRKSNDRTKKSWVSGLTLKPKWKMLHFRFSGKKILQDSDDEAKEWGTRYPQFTKVEVTSDLHTPSCNSNTDMYRPR